MSPQTQLLPKEASSPSLSNVFSRLVMDIVRGHYGPGARLPAERDLAQTLKTSRPTLREALRRLEEWRLIETRRGSGVVVRPKTEWSFAALPDYLRHGIATDNPSELANLVRDLLALRRALLVEMLRFVANRLSPGSLTAARAATRAAWEVREDSYAFVAKDFDVLRGVADASGFVPALWLLNDFWSVYEELAKTFSHAAPIPNKYLETYDAVFNSLERGAIDSACRRLSAYFGEHDRRILTAMGILP